VIHHDLRLHHFAKPLKVLLEVVCSRKEEAQGAALSMSAYICGDSSMQCSSSCHVKQYITLTAAVRDVTILGGDKA
jgi:hypothetical protein